MHFVLTLVLASAQFAANGAIPAAHTCEGADRSPALAWTGVPPAAKSLALVVDDPDAPDPAAPQMTWVHWVVFNLPPALTALPEGVTQKTLPASAREGSNDWKATGWRGPCPPIGRHRYFFKLYALDTVLDGKARLDKPALEAAMRGHIVAQGQLVGTYQKRK